MASQAFTIRPNRVKSFSFVDKLSKHQSHYALQSTSSPIIDEFDRKNLWKRISSLEKEAVSILSSGDESKTQDAYIALANSINLKNQDPFLKLAHEYSNAVNNQDESEINRILTEMKNIGLPPHLLSVVSQRNRKPFQNDMEPLVEEVDPSSNFSDTITEKIRVKVTSFFDPDKSDPINGKFMFWYKVGIYNEGPEPVQVVARMWEIEKCRGDKEIVRGSGILGTQPIISPGDVYNYQSACPLKVFPPKGKRIVGSMSGAYTVCKGNMGQHNFTVKIGKFNLILPESVSSSTILK
jgi:ApaG protein